MKKSKIIIISILVLSLLLISFGVFFIIFIDGKGENNTDDKLVSEFNDMYSPTDLFSNSDEAYMYLVANYAECVVTNVYEDELVANFSVVSSSYSLNFVYYKDELSLMEG